MPLPELVAAAEAIVASAGQRNLKIATAESCTGGLVAAALTEVAGASHVFSYGFITYSNAAKEEVLDVSAALLKLHGAVSEPVAIAMAAGALARSKADVAVAVTGIAGPGGGTPKKPVGLVYIAGMRADGKTISERHEFGDRGRAEVRRLSAESALAVLKRLLD